MKLLTNGIKRVKQAAAKRLFLSFALFLALSVGGALGTTSLNQSGQVDAAGVSACGSNSSNSIIANGATSRSALISKIKASPELQKLYESRGLTAKDYDRFITDAKSGMALDNNTIVVNGDVVANAVGSLGRTKSCQGSNPQTFTVSGAGTYYGNLNSQAFASGNHSIPVDVLFNDQGQVQFAVMTGTCANPTYQTPVKPNYVCHSLQSQSLGNNAYRFTTDASAGNGAKITKLVYDFGDGSATVTTTSPSTAVPHTFTKSAMVTVKVFVSLPGGGQVVLVNCQKQITFTPPPAVFACTTLSKTPGKIDNQGNQTYMLTATASATNATIKSYSYTFDTSGKPSVVNSSAKTVTVNHVYAPGTHNAMVSVTVLTNTGTTKTVTSATCAVQINVKTPECKPGVPQGSKQCFTYTCDTLGITQGDNRTVTIKDFKATTNNPKASVKNVTIDWGDTGNDQPAADKVVGSTHQYAADQSYTITATAHFAIAGSTDDIAVSGPGCMQNVSFTTPTPPTGVLPNTGAGNVVGIFGAVAVLGTLGHRLFLSRRLNHQN